MRSVARKLVESVRPARLADRIPGLTKLADPSRPLGDPGGRRQLITCHPFADPADQECAEPRPRRTRASGSSKGAPAHPAQLDHQLIQLVTALAALIHRRSKGLERGSYAAKALGLTVKTRQRVVEAPDSADRSLARQPTANSFCNESSWSSASSATVVSALRNSSS
jgi:hypothetical protein